MPRHLHLGGPLHGKQARVDGAPASHPHLEHQPVVPGHSTAWGHGIERRFAPDRYVYHRHEIETGGGVVVVYRLKGYCPTAEDEELVMK